MLLVIKITFIYCQQICFRLYLHSQSTLSLAEEEIKRKLERHKLKLLLLRRLKHSLLIFVFHRVICYFIRLTMVKLKCYIFSMTDFVICIVSHKRTILLILNIFVFKMSC